MQSTWCLHFTPTLWFLFIYWFTMNSIFIEFFLPLFDLGPCFSLMCTYHTYEFDCINAPFSFMLDATRLSPTEQHHVFSPDFARTHWFVSPERAGNTYVPYSNAYISFSLCCICVTYILIRYSTYTLFIMILHLAATLYFGLLLSIMYSFVGDSMSCTGFTYSCKYDCELCIKLRSKAASTNIKTKHSPSHYYIIYSGSHLIVKQMSFVFYCMWRERAAPMARKMMTTQTQADHTQTNTYTKANR